jgi:hypothetical protein
MGERRVTISFLRQSYAWYIDSGRFRSLEDITCMFLMVCGSREGHALAGVARWCERFCGFACSAIALVLLFNWKAVVDRT